MTTPTDTSKVLARIVPSFHLVVTEVMTELTRTGEYNANAFIDLLVRNGRSELAAKFVWSKERKRLRKRGLFLECVRGRPFVYTQRSKEDVRELVTNKARRGVVEAADEHVAGLAASQKQPGISEEERGILNKEERDRAKDRDDVVRAYLKHERHTKEWPSGLVEDDD